MIPAYIIIGTLIGFLAGLFGIGGGLISTPFLRIFFGLPYLIALATPLPVIIPTAIAGSYNYVKSGFVKKEIVIPSVIGGLPATMLGAYATKFIEGKWLMILTGIFIVIVGLRLLFASKIQPSELVKNISQFWILIMIGFVSGFMSGLLAIGGGIILIPAYILLLGMKMHEASSNSLVCIAFLAIPGTIVHALLGHIDWLIVLFLSVGVIPASYLGSKTALAIKSEKLRHAFSIFLMTFGLYFIFLQF